MSNLSLNPLSDKVYSPCSGWRLIHFLHVSGCHPEIARNVGDFGNNSEDHNTGRLLPENVRKIMYYTYKTNFINYIKTN